MEQFTIYDGLILTIVSMLVVLLILAAIWGLVELVSKLISRFEQDTDEEANDDSAFIRSLAENPKHKRVAELMALVLASEDQPDKTFVIVESKPMKPSGGTEIL